MATAGAWVVSMQSGQGGAMACRSPCRCALLLQCAPSGLSLGASPSARFISILSSPRPRTALNVIAIHSQDPDFYKIPYVEGIPVGKRLKLWNLPPNCKHSELLEWFAGVDVKVESLEFTDDPVLNAQGIGGFVELATKQDACIAIVRLDGYKFRGHYIRLDFAEKRPHSRDYGSRRSRPNRSSSSGSRGSFATSPRSSVTDMVPSYNGTTSANARYEAANSDANISVQSSPNHASVGSPSISTHGYTGMHLNTTSSQSSFGGSQIPSDSSSTKPLSGSAGIPTQPTYGEAQPSATSSTTQAASNSYNNTKDSPIRTISNNGHMSSHGLTAQGPTTRSLSTSYEPYEDPFKNYGVTDASVVEPWLHNTSFRSGPMFGSPQPSSLNRLFVGNLAVSIDDATLHELFSKFGTVLEARVLRDQESGRSRGFAVIAMSSVDEMKSASKALDGWRVESRPLRVDAVTFKN